MKVYQINYDLRKQRNYQPLYDQLKSYDNWAHPLESCWIIATNKTIEKVLSELTAVVDANDGLFITRLQGEAAWENVDGDNAGEMTDWLQQNLGQAA